MKPVREHIVEQYLVRETEKRGGLCFKFNSGVNGVPDRIILINGQTFFVECKRPGGKPRPEQISMHRQMKKRDIDVHIVDTKESIDAFFSEQQFPQPIEKEETTRIHDVFELMREQPNEKRKP